MFSKKIREIAAADATAKADVYARAMGVTLGQLVYFAELGDSAPMAGNSVFCGANLQKCIKFIFFFGFILVLLIS